MLTDVSEVHTASIIRAMSNIYLTTWQYIPEDSKLQAGFSFRVGQEIVCFANVLIFDWCTPNLLSSGFPGAVLLGVR
jgi:hypothetical protein